MAKILLIEDDPTLSESIRALLIHFGYEAVSVCDFKRILETFEREKPDLVLLDINLPHMDGFYFIRAFRRSGKVPVILLSARSGASDQVLGMELGADDYVVKPFHMEVLLAKINALLRRSIGELASNQKSTLAVGRLSLDEPGFQAICGNKGIPLTRNEFLLLKKLMEKNGGLISREELFEALWDDQSFVDENTLAVNVTRVRQKLSDLGFQDSVKTRRGLGYYLDTEVFGG